MKRRQDVSEAFEGLMRLFADDLKDVAFPLVDIEILRAAATRCEERQRTLDDAEAALAGARDDLDRARTELVALTDKAIAYLRIYAAEDAELAVKIDALDPKKRKGTKRGRSKAKGAAGPRVVDAAPASGAVAKAS